MPLAFASATAINFARFRLNWKWHHPLEDVQIAFAGQLTAVATVGYYHGGDVLYTLDGVPGIWHEACLEGAT